MVCPVFLAVSISLTKLDKQSIDDRHLIRDSISPLAGFTLVSSLLSVLFLSEAKLFKGKLFCLYMIFIYLCGLLLMVLAFLTLLVTSMKHQLMWIPLIFFWILTIIYARFIVWNGHEHDAEVYRTSGDKLENSVDFLATITFLLFLGLGGTMLGGQYSTIQGNELKYKELLLGSLWLSFTTCIAGVAVMLMNMLPPAEISGNKMKGKDICHILDGIDYIFGVVLALIVLLITHGTLRSWWAFGAALGMSIFPFGVWSCLVIQRILNPREEEEEEVKPASLDLTKVTFTGFLGISVYTLNNCPDSINRVRFSFILLTAMAVNAGLGWRLFTHEKNPSPARFKAAYVASWCTRVCLAAAVIPFAWMSFRALQQITTTIPAPSPRC
ncbi:hypothetical protein D1007_39572 [Hordeum vulgare]|nr:hypothetical protein D1007_39572 [Hordeum vulgare]